MARWGDPVHEPDAIALARREVPVEQFPWSRLASASTAAKKSVTAADAGLPASLGRRSCSAPHRRPVVRRARLLPETRCERRADTWGREREHLQTSSLTGGPIVGPDPIVGLRWDGGAVGRLRPRVDPGRR